MNFCELKTFANFGNYLLPNINKKGFCLREHRKAQLKQRVAVSQQNMFNCFDTIVIKLQNEKKILIHTQTSNHVFLLPNRWSLKFRNIHGKTPVLESLLTELQASRPATFLKRDRNTCFPVKFEELLRTPLGNCLWACRLSNTVCLIS